MKKVIYTTPEEMERQKRISKKIKKYIIYPMLTLLIILIIIISTMPKEEKQQERVNLKSVAYIISQNYVKTQLKAPSSAEFPRHDYVCYKKDSITYVVTSYVDSQNSFGAMIRTKYQAILKYNGGNAYNNYSWELQSLDFN